MTHSGEKVPKVKVPMSASLGDECFEYGLQHDERFLKRIESARKSIRAGRGRRLEDIED